MIFSKRKYIIKSNNRQFLDFIPPISILLGGFIFIAGTMLAVFLYQTPKGGYEFFNQYFSELGIRGDYFVDDGQRYAPDNPEIFNVALFAAGTLMVPFFMFTYRQMRNRNRVSNFFLLIASIGGVIAGPMLIGVGLFDLSFVSDIFWQDHTFWTGWLYILLTVTSICWFFMLLMSKDLPYRTTKWILVDYLFLLILIVLTIVNITDGINILKVADIPLLNMNSVETYQKLIAYFFFLYYGLIVGVRLTKTKYDNTPI